jgi:hypothetical protein
VTKYVIIEADSAEEANNKAEEIGIYFDGCDKDMDCSCCGDRWHSVYGEGDETPMIYGKPVEEHDCWFTKAGNVYAYVYYADGTKKEHIK